MLRDMRVLLRMGCILFYTDTDSIIFLVAKDRRAEVESILNVGSAAYGGYKFETDGGLIVFVTLGPKNYAYTTSNGLQVVKTRGFTLTNKAALDVLNADSMRSMLREHLAGKATRVEVACRRIAINRRRQSLHSVDVVKKYRNDVFDKRAVVSNANPEENPYVETMPFGARHRGYADCF